MKKSQMPLDSQANPIPVLGLNTASYQTIDGSSASAQSTLFSETEITVVRLAAVDAVWFKIGENPTAIDSQGAYLPAGAIEYIAIYPNEKIAAIGGVLNMLKTK